MTPKVEADYTGDVLEPTRELPLRDKQTADRSVYLASTAAASLDLILVPFFAYYLLVDFSTWRSSSEALIPPRFRQTFERLFDEVGRIVESYVTGQLLVAMIMASLYAIGFWILGGC